MNNEERAAKMSGLQFKWNTLSPKLSLDHLTSEMESLTSKIEGLPEKVADLRKRGFHYHNDWETRADVLKDKWRTKRVQARSMVTRQSSDIRSAASDVDDLLEKGRWADSSATRLESVLATLETRVDSAERNVKQFYTDLQSDASALEGEFYRALFLLDSLSDATFQLYPDEAGVSAVKATWTSDGQEPEGILFLTDSRLIFEQREKKATKKVLFVTTKSELIQEKLWEAPVGAIDEMTTEDKGLLGGKQFITFRFKERTRELPGEMTLQLMGMSNDEWVETVKALQSGALVKEHVGFTAPEAATVAAPPAPPVATPASEIPTKCPACGGKLPVAYQGVRELVCEYCGNVIYL